MRQYIIYLGIGLLALGLASCERDALLEEPTGGNALAEGQFVVDYSGEVTTRAIKDNATKGERINSLTYLLYQWSTDENGNGEGILLKSREIPGLEGINEEWPLTRANMSWEQREALKDTLSVGGEYRAVFIANIARGLWNGERYLNDSTSYSTANLQLPAEPFADNNMFYLSTAEIDGTTATREEPVNCSIVLKRVVTRTDWWFERLPEVSFPEGNIDLGSAYPLYPCVVDKNIQSYLYNSIYSLVSKEMDGGVQDEVVEETKAMLVIIKQYCEVNAKDIVIVDTDTEEVKEKKKAEIDKWNGYAADMEALSTAIDDGGSGRESFWKAIGDEVTNVAPEGAEEQNVPVFQTHLQNVLMTLVSYNTKLQNRWKASWRLADTESGTTAKVTAAKITYKDGSQVDQYFFNKAVKQVTEVGVSPSIPFDATTKVNGYTYEGFNLVSFALAEGNKSTKIELYNGDTSVESFEVPENAAQTGQGTNEWYQLLYRPIVSIEEGSFTKDIIINPDLETTLPFSILNKPEDYISELKGIMLEALNDGKSDLEKLFSLKEYKLTISVPDLSAEDVIINDSWNNPERVNK